MATLGALVVGIGVGSTLFHTVATPWALLVLGLLGTHALWHGLNALVLALTCSVLLSAPGRPSVGKTGG